jgi:2-polyprenyl-3-methyl-5-hydroxy-6-metoxy-1,4-benzoquinol methylase
MESFKAAKKKFKTAFTDILKDTNNLIIDEAALPAYAHHNPFIDYLFWKRLEVAFTYVNRNGLYKKVLDFGCGSGVLSYVLAHHGYEVTACDLEFSPLRLVQKKIDFPPAIHFIEGDIRTQNLPDHSFDVIFALDVLEHIENTGEYIQLFKKLLTPAWDCCSVRAY